MKKGFTLAEVLITLGIIGVVAALTIPTLNISTKEKSLNATRKVCVSDLENAFTTMMASEGAADMEETKAFAENNIIENLQRYIKVYKDSSSTNPKCIMKNGAEIVFSEPAGITDTDGNTITEAVRKITIDINGSDVKTGKPNREGIDIFKYALLPTGLLEEALEPEVETEEEPEE